MEDIHIPDESILASSFFHSGRSSKSRLFKDPYGWIPAVTDQNAYLQIEAGSTDHVITAVATQGSRNDETAVIKLQLSFSKDGLHWFEHKEDGEVRVIKKIFYNTS